MTGFAKKTFAFVAVGVLLAFPIVSAQTATSEKTTTPDVVRFFPHDQVAASFDKSAVIVDRDNYKVITAKRDHPGEVEVHKQFTDVIYIVDGNATIMIGGRILGERAADTDEPRGTAIDGGTTYKLSPGDVITIPAGVPHWVNQVPGLFHYFVVKVPKSAE